MPLLALNRATANNISKGPVIRLRCQACKASTGSNTGSIWVLDSTISPDATYSARRRLLAEGCAKAWCTVKLHHGSSAHTAASS